MRHYFEDVPGLGNVAVSRHAQERMAGEGITERQLVASIRQRYRLPS